jgi:phage/plasmid-like protein (TIGR03299 family)
MAHKIVQGIDRVAATQARTIWHADETLGVSLRDFTMTDPESTLLEMAGYVWPTDADNDVARTVGLVTADGLPIGTHVATVSRTGRVLGVVGSDYNPVPFKVILTDWLYALALAGAAPETLGTCDEGRNMFASVLVADEFRVPGDEHETRPYFNLVSNHTGQGGIKGSFATFRPVCFNTASMFGEQHDKGAHKVRDAWVLVKHTRSASQSIKDAVQWIVDGRARAESERDLLARMANVTVDKVGLQGFVDRYISQGDTPKAEARREGEREKFLAAMRAADLGAHALTSRGITAYGLFQAVTNFEDWRSTVRRTDDTPVATRRAFRAFMGEREPEKQTARQHILELAGI